MARPGFANRDDLLRWANSVAARTEFPISSGGMGDGTGCSPARLPQGIGDVIWRLGRADCRLAYAHILDKLHRAVDCGCLPGLGRGIQ